MGEERGLDSPAVETFRTCWDFTSCSTISMARRHTSRAFLMSPATAEIFRAQNWTALGSITDTPSFSNWYSSTKEFIHYFGFPLNEIHSQNYFTASFLKLLLIHRRQIYINTNNLTSENKIAVYLQGSLHRRWNHIEMQEIRFLHLYSQNASS